MCTFGLYHQRDIESLGNGVMNKVVIHIRKRANKIVSSLGFRDKKAYSRDK